MSRDEIIGNIQMSGIDSQVILDNILCNYLSTEELEDLYEWLCGEYEWEEQ